MDSNVKIIVDAFLPSIELHLYHGPKSGNLRALSALAIPGIIEYVERLYHLPMTKTLIGLQWNYSHVYLTETDEQKRLLAPLRDIQKPNVMLRRHWPVDASICWNPF